MESTMKTFKKIIFKKDMEGTSDLESIKSGAKILYENGYVKESFIDAIQDREKVFPTGLPTEGFGVAIPHTDAEHVNESVVGIFVLKHPVLFKLMGSYHESVEVKILFMMAIDEPHGQLEMLQQIIGFIQDKEKLISIGNCRDLDELNSMLESF